jgi:hypothetical protein
MKSYLQGMITGGVMVFAMFIFMGQIASQKELIQSVIDEKLINSRLIQNEIGTYQVAFSGHCKI